MRGQGEGKVWGVDVRTESDKREKTHSEALREVVGG